MKRLLLLGLFASFAFGAALQLQPVGGSTATVGSSAGVQTATTASMLLSVNPDGGQTSGCLSATGATSDCRTVMAAVASIPKIIRHNVLLFIDAGTYSGESLVISGFSSEQPDAGANPPTLTIKGPQVGTDGTGFTLATGLSSGTASGTITAYTAASGTTLTVMTDSTANWTTDNLVGWGVSSSLSATTWVPIVSNTATTITLNTTLGTVVPNTTTYTINRPSATIAGAGGNSLLVMGNNLPIVLQDITVLQSTSSTWAKISNNGGGPGNGFSALQCTRCVFINTAAAAPTVNLFNNYASVGFSSSLLYSVRSQVFTATNGQPGATISWSGVMQTQQSSNPVMSIIGGDYTISGVLRNQFTSGSPIDIGRNSPVVTNILTGTLKLMCGASSTVPAIFADGQTGTHENASLIRIVPNTLSTLSCLRGIDASGQVSWIPVNGGTTLIDTTGTSGTTVGFQLKQGAKFYLNNSVHTYTFTSVSREVMVDGVSRALASLAGTSVTNLPTGTSAIGGLVAGPMSEGLGITFPINDESVFPSPADAGTAAWSGTRGMILFGSDAGTLYVAETAGVGVNPAVTGEWRPLMNGLISRPVGDMYVNVAGVAATTYGGAVVPFNVHRQTVDSIGLRVSVAGSGGTTAATLRVTDGTSNCDCTLAACNQAAGNKLLACSGGCIYDGGASLTYSVQSIGDCVTGPLILGTATINGTRN